MSNFYTAGSYNSFELFKEEAKMWNLEFTQLGSGPFRADHLMFGDSDIQIGKVHYNKLLLQNGSAPPGGYTFAIHHHQSAPLYWRYLDFEYGSILVFPANNEHQGVSQPGHHPITITISNNFLETVAYQAGLPSPDKFILKGNVFKCAPDKITQIQQVLLNLCGAVKCTQGADISHTMNFHIKYQLTHAMLSVLAMSRGVEPKKRQFSNRKKVVDQIMQHVSSDWSSSISIGELSCFVKVDERTLRNIFHEQFSISPKQFLNRYRLNAVRKVLVSSGSSESSITDIANAYGFWHMGQFAKDYRKLFNELPSESRTRISDRLTIPT